MPQFKNLTELHEYLQKAVDSALTNEVYQAVKEKQQEVIQEEVYDRYKPAHYKRRKSNGGLIADRNIIIYGAVAKNGILIVRNITPPNPYLDGVSGARTTTPMSADTPKLIEYGIYNPSGYGYDYWSGAKKRPFTEKTIEELQSSDDLKIALKDGLKRQGIVAK